jgi:ribose transport system permease protein
MSGATLVPGPAARLVGKFAPGISLVFVALLFYILFPDRPLSVADVRTILVHTVIIGLAALGMTLVIVSGGIDLSVGSAVALSSIAAAKTMQVSDARFGPVAAIVAAVATGAACGAYNGALIAVFRLPPFIVTLGTLGFYRGLAKWWADEQSVSAPTGWLSSWASPTPPAPWMLVAPVVWLLLVIAGIMAVVLHRTVPGRFAVAIGSNEEAARRAGVSLVANKIAIYAASGVLVGLAGVVLFVRQSGMGDPVGQVGLELSVIATVAIGGASLSGGYASITGTLCGALLIKLLDNRCAAANWPNYVQDLVVGHIIIAAVAIDHWRRRRGIVG